jgi:zinc protease
VSIATDDKPVTLRRAEGGRGAGGTHIQEITSPGGIRAWLVEEYAVPIVAMDFAFRGGAAQDPAGLAGASHVLAGTLDEGAGPYDADAFQERLDEFAIDLSFSASRDSLGGRVKALTRHVDEAFRMLALALNEARLAEDAVARVQAQLSAGIRREMAEPGAVSSKAWIAAAFPGHPYGRPERGDLASVAAITRADLVARRQALLARSNLVVGVVGAISAAALGPLLDSVFGGLPASASLTAVPRIAPAVAPAPIVLDMDIPQTTIRFGRPAPLRSDPDFVAAVIVNHILGGGSFTSRLWQEVREKRGLAYSVSSQLQGLEHAGLLLGGTATMNERAAESLAVIRAEIDQMRQNGPQPEELAKAKRYLIGSYALRFDTSTKIAGQLVQLQLEGFGPDYIARRNGLFEAVTLEDAHAAAARMLGDGSLLVAMAGRPVDVS